MKPTGQLHISMHLILVSLAALTLATTAYDSSEASSEEEDFDRDYGNEESSPWQWNGTHWNLEDESGADNPWKWNGTHWNLEGEAEARDNGGSSRGIGGNRSNRKQDPEHEGNVNNEGKKGQASQQHSGHTKEHAMGRAGAAMGVGSHGRPAEGEEMSRHGPIWKFIARLLGKARARPRHDVASARREHNDHGKTDSKAIDHGHGEGNGHSNGGHGNKLPHGRVGRNGGNGGNEANERQGGSGGDDDEMEANFIVCEEFFLLQNATSRCSAEQANAKIQSGLMAFVEAFQDFPGNSTVSVCCRQGESSSSSAFKRVTGTVVQLKVFVATEAEARVVGGRDVLQRMLPQTKGAGKKKVPKRDMLRWYLPTKRPHNG